VAGNICPFGWSPDGEYVYAVRDRSEIIRVRSNPPNEISSVAVLSGNIVEYDGASVGPDGRQIIVSVAAESSDVWLMENKK
jgi:Tol biopolymer transport system component